MEGVMEKKRKNSKGKGIIERKGKYRRDGVIKMGGYRRNKEGMDREMH